MKYKEELVKELRNNFDIKFKISEKNSFRYNVTLTSLIIGIEYEIILSHYDIKIYQALGYFNMGVDITFNNILDKHKRDIRNFRLKQIGLDECIGKD